MTIRGDFKGLAAFGERVRQAGQALPEIAARAAPRLQRLQRQSMSDRTDAYGKPWNTFPGHDADPSVATVEASENAITAEVPFESTHTIPTEDQGIPPTWRTELETVAAEVIAEKLGGK